MHWHINYPTRRTEHELTLDGQALVYPSERRAQQVAGREGHVYVCSDPHCEEPARFGHAENRT